MVNGVDYSGFPLPSVWAICWGVLVFLWMLARVLWPVFLLLLGWGIVRGWLERRLRRRRWRRG